jgi:hypothetical protein
MKKTYVSPEFSVEGLIDEQKMLMASKYDTEGVKTQDGGSLGGRSARVSSEEEGENVGC